MPTLSLNILVVPTYNSKTFGVIDASVYPDDPPVVTSPTIEITPPGFDTVSLPFIIEEMTVYNSTTLGLTDVGEDVVILPDGVYYMKYSIAPAYTNYVEKSIMRIDHIQEEFDEAFMKLDMMECDRAIKKQAKEDLTTIYFFIQASVAAANNCAVDQATKLYTQAAKMLFYFIENNCGCSNNYLVNFV